MGARVARRVPPNRVPTTRTQVMGQDDEAHQAGRLGDVLPTVTHAAFGEPRQHLHGVHEPEEAGDPQQTRNLRDAQVLEHVGALRRSGAALGALLGGADLVHQDAGDVADQDEEVQEEPSPEVEFSDGPMPSYQDSSFVVACEEVETQIHRPEGDRRQRRVQHVPLKSHVPRHNDGQPDEVVEKNEDAAQIPEDAEPAVRVKRQKAPAIFAFIVELEVPVWCAERHVVHDLLDVGGTY
mmetsp:Transcript_43650/g.111125  ORF Transcript_43650/g.111125 Transcript_43650/m.111125 type:complete len:238 (+) Transcript_43650:1857-2570(+)